MSPESAGRPLLEVRDLRTDIVTASRVLPAVDRVSFDLSAGETLGLVGESGCGKTMTALSIMRLLPPSARVSGGEVLLSGRDLLRLPEAEMCRVRGDQISIVFQEPTSALNPVFRVGAQIAEAIRLHRGASRSEAMAEAVRALAAVSIPDAARRAREYPHEFSGGMRQRALIAMALACRPALLIADEPTTALDVTIQAEILETLQRLQREIGLAMLLITHDLGVVAETAERVAVMYCGRIVEQAPVADLFRDPKHPYTRGLLACAGGRGGSGENAAAPKAISGMVPDIAARPMGCPFWPRCPEARDRCRVEEPQPASLGGGREVACFLYPETR